MPIISKEQLAQLQATIKRLEERNTALEEEKKNIISSYESKLETVAKERGTALRGQDAAQKSLDEYKAAKERTAEQIAFNRARLKVVYGEMAILNKKINTALTSTPKDYDAFSAAHQKLEVLQAQATEIVASIIGFDPSLGAVVENLGIDVTANHTYRDSRENEGVQNGYTTTQLAQYDTTYSVNNGLVAIIQEGRAVLIPNVASVVKELKAAGFREDRSKGVPFSNGETPTDDYEMAAKLSTMKRYSYQALQFENAQEIKNKKAKEAEGQGVSFE